MKSVQKVINDIANICCNYTVEGGWNFGRLLINGRSLQNVYVQKL